MATKAGADTSRKLGIVAGGGPLPRRVVDRCLEEGRPFFVLALDGFAQRGAFDDVPHMTARIGAAGRYLERMRAEGVADIVMVGPVRRPSFVALRPDATALKIMTVIGAKSLGDDGLLRSLIGYFERHYGWHFVGIEDVLPDLEVASGPLGAVEPDDAAWRDIRRARAVLDAMAAADVGQAVVVQEGLVLGVEAIEGTDALLERCAGLRRDGPGGVLVKMAKRGQDLRADRPTVGPGTVEKARDAGLRGIAVEAGMTTLVDRERMVATADAAGLFLIGLDSADPATGSGT